MAMEMDVAVTEHRIPDANWPSFTAKFDKLAKRARKLGAGEIAYNVVRIDHDQRIRETRRAFGSVAMDWDDLEPRERTIPADAPIPEGWTLIGHETFHVVTVSGDRPKLNGWRFIGTLQNLRDDENKSLMILRNVPGETIPATYRAVEQFCDHCKTRRYRIDTYVVQHDDGRTAQVGSDCLKDFTGHASPDAIARFAEYLMELDALMGNESEGGEGGSGEGALYLPYVLALTAARVRVKGWMSRRKAREINETADQYAARVEADYVSGLHTTTGRLRTVEATADAVSLYLDKKRGPREMNRDGVEITEADEVEAAASLEWIRAQDRAELQRKADNGSDYLWNLYAACLRSDTSYRTLGIVCSLIAAYQREMGRQAERKARNEKWASSQFVGEIKRREVFELKLTAEPQHYANDFGGSYLHRLEDRNGNQLVWWASSLLMTNEETREPGQDAEFWSVDQWLKVKATPVKHEERNGIKQTTVNRVAIEVPKLPKPRKAKAA